MVEVDVDPAQPGQLAAAPGPPTSPLLVALLVAFANGVGAVAAGMASGQWRADGRFATDIRPPR